MSAEILFDPWDGQDLADRLTEGFNDLIHTHAIKPPSFTWPNPPKSNLFEVDFPIQSFGKIDNSRINGVSAILDIGNQLGQAGAEFGASVNGMVEQFFRRLPGVLFRKEDESRAIASLRADLRRNEGAVRDKDESMSVSDRFRDFRFVGDDSGQEDDENDTLNLTLYALVANCRELSVSHQHMIVGHMIRKIR